MEDISRLANDWARFLVCWSPRIDADDLTDDESKRFNDEARGLGKRINAVEGMTSMLWFHRYAQHHCPQGFARLLEMCWDDIGDWRG